MSDEERIMSEMADAYESFSKFEFENERLKSELSDTQTALRNYINNSEKEIEMLRGAILDAIEWDPDGDVSLMDIRSKLRDALREKKHG